MFYKNMSIATKTFYGITFKPGEIKEVPGYINDKSFIACSRPATPARVASKSAAKSTTKPSVAESKKHESEVKDKSTKTEEKEESVNG